MHQSSWLWAFKTQFQVIFSNSLVTFNSSHITDLWGQEMGALRPVQADSNVWSIQLFEFGHVAETPVNISALLSPEDPRSYLPSCFTLKYKPEEAQKLQRHKHTFIFQDIWREKYSNIQPQQATCGPGATSKWPRKCYFKQWYRSSRQKSSCLFSKRLSQFSIECEWTMDEWEFIQTCFSYTSKETLIKCTLME